MFSRGFTRCHEIDALTVLRSGPLTICQVANGEYSIARELRQIVEGIISADTSGLASSRVKKAAGEAVFKEGDKGHFMYHVEDGMIEIVQNSTVLERAETGGIVAEMALVKEDGRRSANAVVRRNATPILINKRRFRAPSYEVSDAKRARNE